MLFALVQMYMELCAKCSMQVAASSKVVFSIARVGVMAILMVHGMP